MNKSIQPTKETPASHTVEARLGKLGCDIDALIHQAQRAKDRLLADGQSLETRGSAAVHEMIVALDHAWDDLHEAWKDLAQGVDRVRDALHGRVMKDEYFDCTGLDETD